MQEQWLIEMNMVNCPHRKVFTSKHYKCKLKDHLCVERWCPLKVTENEK